MQQSAGTISAWRKRMQPERWRGRGSPDTPSLLSRLWNWGAWGRSDPGGPDGSCVNSIWDQWNPYGAGRDEGWGEPESAPASEEIDEQDAEAMDCWVRQLHREPRALLVQRFVMRKRVSWDTLDPAVRALGDLIERNWLAVEAMRGKV